MKKKFTVMLCMMCLSAFAIAQVLPDNLNFRNESGGQIFLKSTKEMKQRLDQIVYETYSLNTSQWSNDAKVVYNYNSNFDVAEAITYDYIEGVWVNDTKEECTYNGNGDILQVIESDWNGSAWLYSKKYDYTYNGSGYIETKTTSLYQSSSWVNSMKSEYTYDGNGKMTLDFISSWSSTKGWTTHSKYEYNYNGNQQISEIVYSIIDLGMGEWNLNKRNAFTHDGEGNLTKRDDATWQGDWSVYQYEEFTYNNAYALVDMLLPYSWLLNYCYFVHKLTGSMQSIYNYDIVNFMQYRRGTFTYSQQNVGICGNLYNEVSVYPNPATEFVMFDLDENNDNAWVEFYDLRGTKVFTSKLSDNTGIWVGQLPKGSYICKIRSNNSLRFCKLIIK